jgi:hypothetical protein
MSAGRTNISRTTLGAITDLVTGDFACMPHYLYFYPEGGGDSIRLDHARQAFHCNGCDAFVIAGTKTKPEERKQRGEEHSSDMNPG